MGKVIGVMGESGSGKTTAMRNLDPATTFYFDCDKKGEWSGWKVKIDYEVHNGHEQNYRAERWFFLDKEGSVIFKTMEFPLP